MIYRSSSDSGQTGTKQLLFYNKKGRKMEKLSNPQKTIEILQKYQFVFQKRFGQNFLIDPHVLEKIMAAAQIGPEDCVLESGPGIGTMT